MRFQCPFCQGVVAVPNTDMGSDCQCGLCGEMVSVPTSRVATGSVIQDFIILEELGRGGMGVVYLTHQITLDRPSALKILAGAYANNPEFVVDFIKEARAAAKLNHPHIVQAYAVGEDEGIYFFAMEHIDGETMKDFMKREGVVPIEFALEVIQQIAEALDYAWKEQRLVHRDIKPDNIMLTRKGRAKLADLGLARVAGDIDDADSDEVMGTPQYISPEHLTGEEMDVRSDIYSLGATLFHIITGRFAFEGRTATDIARKHLEEPLQPPREVNPSVPESVSRIIIKMMAKNANERYQSAEDLVEDIRLARQGKGPSSSTGAVQKQGKGGKQFSLKKSGSKTGTYQAASASGGKTLSSSGSKSKTIKTSGSKTLSASRGKTLSSSSTGIRRSPLTSTGSSPMSDLAQAKLEKERKAKNQLIIMAAIVVAVLMAGAAFMIWNAVSGDGDKKPPTNGGGNTGGTGGNPTNGGDKPPPVSPYIKSAEELLAFASTNRGKEEDIINRCEGFFSANPEPATDEEKVKKDELMAVYVPLDEKRVKKARAEERKKHEDRLKAAQADAQRKKEEDEKKRLAEERRKAREAREKQVALELEQQRKKRLAEFKENLKSDKKSYRYWNLYYSTQQNFKEARKILQPGIKKISKITDDLYKLDAQKMTDWATRMDKHLETAEKTWDQLGNSGNKYAKIQIEPKPGTLAKVAQINNGIVQTKTFDNKNFSIPLLKLRNKDLKKILSSFDEGDLPNGAFHFLFSAGNFVLAEDFLPDDWKEEFETSTQVYLVKRLQDIEDLESDSEIKKAKTELYRKAGKSAYLKAVKAMQDE